MNKGGRGSRNGRRVDDTREEMAISVEEDELVNTQAATDPDLTPYGFGYDELTYGEPSMGKSGDLVPSPSDHSITLADLQDAKRAFKKMSLGREQRMMEREFQMDLLEYDAKVYWRMGFVSGTLSGASVIVLLILLGLLLRWIWMR